MTMAAAMVRYWRLLQKQTYTRAMYSSECTLTEQHGLDNSGANAFANEPLDNDMHMDCVKIQVNIGLRSVKLCVPLNPVYCTLPWQPAGLAYCGHHCLVPGRYLGLVHEVHEGIRASHAADHAEHAQIRQIGGAAPHEALPRWNALRPLIRAGVQSLPEIALDAVLFDQAARDAVHQPRARHPRRLPLCKVEVAVLGDVVEGLPGLPQRAVDVDGEQLHKALVHPLSPLDLLSHLGFSHPGRLKGST